jgi:hypothetical protein
MHSITASQKAVIMPTNNDVIHKIDISAIKHAINSAVEKKQEKILQTTPINASFSTNMLTGKVFIKSQNATSNIANTTLDLNIIIKKITSSLYKSNALLFNRKYFAICCTKEEMVHWSFNNTVFNPYSLKNYFSTTALHLHFNAKCKQLATELRSNLAVATIFSAKDEVKNGNKNIIAKNLAICKYCDEFICDGMASAKHQEFFSSFINEGDN